MNHTLPWDAVVLLTLIFITPLLCLFALASWGSAVLARRWKLIPPDRRSWFESGWVTRPAAGVLVVYASCFAYGTLIEADWVETTHTTIKVDQPVLGYDRFRIVQLSD